MNCCSLVGRLARAPLVRWEGDGIQTATCTLMIVEPGREKDFTLYVPLTFWGKAAEHASLLEAQDLVSVQGRLGWRKTSKETSQLCVQVREIAVLQPAEVGTHL